MDKQRGWVDVLRTVVRWIVAATGILTVGGFALVGFAANMQPSAERFDGWVALMQRFEGSSASQVVLGGYTAVSSTSDPSPLTSIHIRACGGKFDGVLLLGGGARLNAPHVFNEQGKETATWDNIDLNLRQGNQVWEFGQVQRVPVSINALDCLSDTSGVAVGQGVEVAGTMSTPLKSTPSFLGVTGPRTSVTWPLVGGLPGVPARNKGVFTTVGDLEGDWVIPPALTNEINLGTLAGATLVEAANPPLQDSGKLQWSSTLSLQPVVRLTDTMAVAKFQQWLVPLGILLGITGSVLASMLFEWAKPKTSSLHSPAAPTSPDATLTPATSGSSGPGMDHNTDRKRSGTAAALALAGLIGYFMGRRR